MIKRILCLSVFLLSTGSSIAFGQVFTVTGIVTDDTGEILPGVNVIVKGTTQGTATDAEGKYTLHQVKAEYVLQFSYVGHTTVEIAVGNKRTIDIALKRGVLLEELVVVGKKRRLNPVQIVEVILDDVDFLNQISYSMQYLFPAFTEGVVYYKNRPKSIGKLNYNILLGEMHFEENGQTLALDNVNDVVMVVIDDRKFYPFKGDEFCEELLSTETGDLLVRHKGNMTTHSKTGGYGVKSISSVTAVSSVLLPLYNSTEAKFNAGITQTKFPVVQEDMILVTNYFYYLQGTNGKRTMIKNLNAFTSKYPAHKAKIRTFVKENKIKLDNRVDLIRLLDYCASL